LANFLDVCRFVPTAGGTADWVYLTAVTGYQSPTAAGAVNGVSYVYRAESADLSQWEIGRGIYNSSTGTFARTAILYNSLGTTAKVNFSTVPQVAIVAIAEDLLRSVPGIQNGTIVETRSGGASTRALKTLNGNDPSPVDPVFMTFPDGSQGVVTGPLSLTIPSTGTMGTVGGIPFRLWDVLINDAGTIRLGTRNCSDANGTYGFPATGLLSSTIITSPNSVGTTYTNAAVSNKPFLLLGYSTYEGGQSVAGTWALPPSPYVVYAPGMPTPGQLTGISAQFMSSATFSRTLASWGDSALALSLVLSSAANLVETFWSGGVQIDTASHVGYAALRRGGSVIGQAQRWGYGAANMIGELSNSWMDFPGIVNPSYVVSTQVDTAAAAIFYFMAGGTPTAGGVLKLAEVMG
jgi:hypothetical protein